MTVRYDEIHLYAKPGQAASATVRQWLDTEGIAYTNLDFPDPTETLGALFDMVWMTRVTILHLLNARLDLRPSIVGKP